MNLKRHLALKNSSLLLDFSFGPQSNSPRRFGRRLFCWVVNMDLVYILVSSWGLSGLTRTGYPNSKVRLIRLFRFRPSSFVSFTFSRWLLISWTFGRGPDKLLMFSHWFDKLATSFAFRRLSSIGCPFTVPYDPPSQIFIGSFVVCLNKVSSLN